jgi:DNA-binding CsgD family transcriptional regulator
VTDDGPQFSTHSSAPTVLFGRDREQGRIDSFLTGHDGALVLTGEPGVGKTALLDHARATAAGWRVMRLVGSEAEQGIPLAGLHQLVYPLAPHVDQLGERDATLLHELLDGHAMIPSVMGAGIAVLELLHVAASAAPLLVLLDDAQWLDVESSYVLGFVARRLGEGRAKFLIAARGEPVTPLREAGLDEIPVGALDDRAAAAVLTRRFPGLGAAARAVVLEHAAGNPLALVELPTSIGSDAAVDEAMLGAALPLTARLERVFAGRLARLDPEARHELLLGALDGLAAGVGGGSGTAGGPAGGGYRMRSVDAAIALGLLTADAAGRVAFRHPLVRSAVVQLATPNERRDAHARLAEVHAGDLERRASHLSAAVVDPDETVASDLERAAQYAVRRGGAIAAVAWLTRAAELSEQASERTRRLAEAAYIAGQAALLDQARDLMDRAAPDGQAGPGAVITAAYEALYRHGDVESAHRALVATLRREGGDLDDDTLGRLVYVLLAVDHFAASAEKWTEANAIIDANAARLSEVALICRATWGDAVRFGAGARERIAEAFLTVSAGEPWSVMRLGTAAYYVDALAEHRAIVTQVIEREASAGAKSNLMTLLQLRLLDEFASGEWDAALATAERGIPLTRDAGYELFTRQFDAFTAIIAAHRGDADAARRTQMLIDAWARPRGLGFLTQYAESIGLALALAEADYEAAYVYAAGLTAPGELAPFVQEAGRTVLDLVEAAVHTGRLDEAARHVAAAQAAGLPALSPRFALITAGAAALVADDDAADAGFRRALELPGAARFAFEAARVRAAYGSWLRRARRYGDAREQLTAARDAFERLGAKPWAARAAAEARAGTPTAGASASLTAQERQIADLAAAGLSNKEIGARLFLSPRTVGAHLYRIFPKLGIASRAALRDALGAADDAADAADADAVPDAR